MKKKHRRKGECLSKTVKMNINLSAFFLFFVCLFVCLFFAIHQGPGGLREYTNVDFFFIVSFSLHLFGEVKQYFKNREMCLS